MKVFLLWIASLPLMAAVDGVVMNQTTGKPQGGATVTLYKVSQEGPESLESVKTGPDGKWVIDKPTTGGPHLLQAAFDGVTYNKMQIGRAHV